jgi:hypothetical protein
MLAGLAHEGLVAAAVGGWRQRDRGRPLLDHCRRTKGD